MLHETTKKKKQNLKYEQEQEQKDFHRREKNAANDHHLCVMFLLMYGFVLILLSCYTKRIVKLCFILRKQLQLFENDQTQLMGLSQIEINFISEVIKQRE